jgi:hypothetical protein
VASRASPQGSEIESPEEKLFMKWGAKILPKDGDIREAHGFLWLPLAIQKETRWLELASWVESYNTHYNGARWVPISWRHLPDTGSSFWKTLYRKLFHQ